MEKDEDIGGYNKLNILVMKVTSVVFYSRNIQEVKKFYLDTIGLVLDYETPTFISFLFPDGMKLAIKLKKEEREIPGSQSVFIDVDDVELLFNDFQNKGISFYKPLTHETWAYEFAILFPDGNKLEFRQVKH